MEVSRAELEQELAEANQNLKELQQEMEQLAYAITHDFREPLRGIATHAQLLVRRSNDVETAELTNYITESVERLNSLVTDVSVYSKSGAPPKRTNMPLSLPVQLALLQVQKDLTHIGGKVVTHDMPQMPVDETQFMQLFKQLIENAMKFRGNEPLVVEISAEEGDTSYIVSVRDNGIGIPSENRAQERIFELFKRLHGKEIPGSGVGLPICRRIVRAHGGKIWVESDGKTGSIFKFSIPF